MDFERRFGGIARLYGAAGLVALGRARVAVIGLGGVGSWAVEALVRSGVGTLLLVDADHVAESSINRQLPATSDTLGRPLPTCTSTATSGAATPTFARL